MITTTQREQSDFLTVLHRITLDLLNRRSSREELLHEIVETASVVLQSSASAILLNVGGELVVKAINGDVPDVLGKSIPREYAALAWQAFESSQPAVVDNYATWKDRNKEYDVSRIRSAAAIPIMVGETNIGVMDLTRHEADFPFNEMDLNKAKLFSQMIALVMENARLYEETLHEIEQRKQVELALLDSERRLRIITDGMSDMVVFVDADSKLLYVNPSFKRILGYEDRVIIGGYGLAHIHPDDLPRISRIFQNAIVTKSNIPLSEYRCVHADGYPVWVEAAGTIIYDDAGQLQGLVAVCREIAERHELQQLRVQEARLQVALQKEKELSELKTRMMTRITHEFRTPLAVIQTSGDILTRHLDRLTPEQVIARTEMIQGQIREIAQMLDMISSGVNSSFVPSSFMPSRFALSDFSRDVVSLVQNRFGTNIITHLRVEPGFSVMGDSSALGIALTNILANAIRFSPENSPILFEVITVKNELVFRIQDRGMGIESAELPRIFEPFFRGQNIGETRGLGLGLTVARAVVEAHQGAITIKSRMNQGTLVSIRLPLISSHIHPQLKPDDATAGEPKLR